MKRALLATVAALGVFGIISSAQAPAPAPYTARCSSCHGPNLQGTAHGPELGGADFKENWGTRSAELLPFIKARMPPGEAGSLPDAAYAEIAAYILRSNGIGGPAPAAPVAPVAPAAPVTVSPASGPAAMTAFGSAFANKVVSNFNPVTDQMLLTPPAGDWLTWRRTLDGQGYSPLNQITRDNVQNLRLAWAL